MRQGRGFRDWGFLGSQWAVLDFGVFFLSCGGDVGVWDRKGVFGVVRSVRGLTLVAFWAILVALVWLWTFMSRPGSSGGLGSMFRDLSWLIGGSGIFRVGIPLLLYVRAWRGCFS